MLGRSAKHVPGQVEVEDSEPNWIPLVPSFTGTPWPDRAAYATWVSEVVGGYLASVFALDDAARADGIARLADVVGDGYDNLAGFMAAQDCFLYAADLDMAPFAAFLSSTPSRDGERFTVLRALAGGDDPSMISEPDVEIFENPKLGEGVRVFRASVPDPGPETGQGAVLGTVGYAFRSDRHGLDVGFHVVGDDIAKLQSCMEDFDGFARGVVVVDA